MQEQKISIGPILILHYEESLVLSNLNLKIFRFHGVRPAIHAGKIPLVFFFTFSYLFPRVQYSMFAPKSEAMSKPV